MDRTEPTAPTHHVTPREMWAAAGSAAAVASLAFAVGAGTPTNLDVAGYMGGVRPIALSGGPMMGGV